MNQNPNIRRLKIDEDGYALQDGVRMIDPAFGLPILQNIEMRDRTYWSSWRDTEVLIEAFDSPLVGLSVQLDSDGLTIKCAYDYSIRLNTAEFEKSICLDEWDRFHFRRSDGVPIVLSRKAQADFFNQLPEFDDDSVNAFGRKIKVPSYFPNAQEAATANFWNQKYLDWKSTDQAPGWDLGKASPFLYEVLPQLKILKQRVAVLGAGAGHDAFHLASLGHLVTAFDISSEAIERAKSLYPESQNLKYVQADLLNESAMSKNYFGQFDLVFEHTFFCAINPMHRTKAIETMWKLTGPDGHLLANFFVITPEGGPPFGATEWELRQRLSKRFKSLYWTRWQTSPANRLGWELIVYAKK